MTARRDISRRYSGGQLFETGELQVGEHAPILARDAVALFPGPNRMDAVGRQTQALVNDGGAAGVVNDLAV